MHMVEKIKMAEDKLCKYEEAIMHNLDSCCCGNFDEKLVEDAVYMDKMFDWLKDVAETKKSLWEAYQAKTIVDAMEKADQNPNFQFDVTDFSEPMMGYDNYRYASGRFAPKGHGHRMGFIPMDVYHDQNMMEEPNWNMGYDSSGNGNSSGSSRGGDRGGSSNSNMSGYSMSDVMHDAMYDPRHGESYNRFKMAQRHYQQSNSDNDRDEMNKHAKAHMKEALDTTKEIYMASSPEMRRKWKEQIMQLVNELPTS